MTDLPDLSKGIQPGVVYNFHVECLKDTPPVYQRDLKNYLFDKSLFESDDVYEIEDRLSKIRMIIQNDIGFIRDRIEDGFMMLLKNSNPDDGIRKMIVKRTLEMIRYIIDWGL